MFFDDWQGILRTLVVGVSAYVVLVFLLRISGKRTLSKWNAFDFVVTVALGSSLATALLSRQVPLAQGVAGFALLVLLQFMVTWLSVRFRAVRRMVKAEPRLLFRRGSFLHEAMAKERVTESEIRAALRGRGIGDAGQVEAVVLETDGSFSIIKDPARGHRSTLSDVADAERMP